MDFCRLMSCRPADAICTASRLRNTLAFWTLLARPTMTSVAAPITASWRTRGDWQTRPTAIPQLRQEEKRQQLPVRYPAATGWCPVLRNVLFCHNSLNVSFSSIPSLLLRGGPYLCARVGSLLEIDPDAEKNQRIAVMVSGHPGFCRVL